MTISVNVAKADEYTFRQLGDLQTNGYSVLRSPHFTNSGLSTTNLGMAALGMEIVGYDWGWITPGGRQLTRNNAIRLGNKKLLDEPLVTTIEASLRTFELYGSGSLADYHVSTLNAAIECGNVVTMSHYVDEHHSIFKEVVKAALKDQTTRQQFKDGIDKYGQRLPAYFSQDEHDLHTDQVYGVRSEAEVRAHVPISVIVAALFAIQAYESGKETIYHLAGSDMTKYIDSYKHTVCLVLAELACQGLIQSDLEAVIVPTANTLTIAREDVHSDVEFLFSQVHQFQAGSQVKRDALRAYDIRLQKLRKQGKYLEVSVLDAKAHGGVGIAVVDNALDLPIGQLQRRASKLI